VLDDWRTAPIDPKLRATLSFIEKLTLMPEDPRSMAERAGDLRTVAPEVAAARAAGVSDEALNDAIYVCALFNLIDRVADALGFDVPASFAAGAAGQLKRGYKM
jgi:alkylhydroperoxidase family enzyme